MNTQTLSASNDPMGTAIHDFMAYGKAEQLCVHSSMFEDDEMPVKHLFRSVNEMPTLEQKALQLSRGRILDVGAGAGCHTLALQERGFNVKAIDISPLCCKTMKERGVKNTECINLFDTHLQGTFDTILLLMNGTGIAGKLGKLPMLLYRLKELMSDDGQVLIDSSDIKYAYENDNGTIDIDLNSHYYGEVDYQMTYKDIKGIPFDWLYVDPTLLIAVCKQCGMECHIVERGSHYDYLAKITKDND